MLAKLLPVFEKYLLFPHVSDGKNKSPLGQEAACTLIIGVSGGPDSIALLDILMQLKKRRPFASLQIAVGHLNHGLRGKTADKDEIFVRKTVEKYRKKYGDSIIFESKRITLPGKSHVEIRGREERRKFFQTLKEKYGAEWIVLAHHADDNLESIFLHFLRGAGPAGLAGMQIAKDGIFRPLLVVSKQKILKYCRQKGLRFRIDRTNKENRFRRNLLRNKIFPLFAKINPSFKKTLIRNAEIFRNIETWLMNEAKCFLDHFDQKYRAIPRKDFRKLPEAIQKTILQLMFQKFTNQPYRLSSVKVTEVLHMIERGIGKKKIQLGKYGSFSLDKGFIRLVAFRNSLLDNK